MSDNSNGASAAKAEKADRRELVERLLRYNRGLAAPPAVLRNIELLASEEAYAVITGQQPGLFTGPLYTIYKTISTLVIAERLSRLESGKRHFIPIFWNHSEDHDFAEVNHIYILHENKPVKLEYRLPEPLNGPRSVSEITLDKQQIAELLARIAKATPESEFKRAILDELHTLATKSHDFGDLFSRLLLWLFGQRGLVLIEPRYLKELLVPVFARLIEEPEAPGRLLNEAGEQLKWGGRTPPLRQPAWFCNFFLDRRRVAYRDGQFIIGEQAHSRDELLQLLQAEPQRFSSDVVTRPLMQDYLFPTYAYIAGPHESAYLAQLQGIYRWFSLPMPRIIPRHRATLVERRIRRILDRYASWAKLEDYRQPERLMKQIIKATSEIGPAFARGRAEIRRILAEIGAQAVRIDPQLQRPCEAAQAKINKVLDQLEAKVAKAQREREPLLQEQIYRAANHLFPLGQPQERVLNITEFLIRHGLVLLEWLEERFAQAEPGEHLIIDLPAH